MARAERGGLAAWCGPVVGGARSGPPGHRGAVRGLGSGGGKGSLAPGAVSQELPGEQSLRRLEWPAWFSAPAAETDSWQEAGAAGSEASLSRAPGGGAWWSTEKRAPWLAVQPSRGGLPRTVRGTGEVGGPGESLSVASARGAGWSATE
ncbi:hypothetical protein NDU88_007005 [Pleurodeles waltl]|uniref:Uncharacterized protein n=1 Tax=Pleurodeles waltl TaxID=8319 RepID=A0AAV7NWS2_PLEWA|nr:hypothetical protein NDU88_007005 [Pleurodeles waltl]